MSIQYYEGNQFAPIIDLGADPDNEGNNLVFRISGTLDSVPSDSVSDVNPAPKTEEETTTEDATETTEENGGTNAEG